MNQLFTKYLWTLLILGLACQPAKEQSAEETPVEVDPRPAYYGTWDATWVASEEAFPGSKDSELTMNGLYVFSEDSISVTLYGHPGCLFGHDTISNRSRWSISGDTLSLIGDDNTPNIMYQVKSQDNNKVELIFLEDLFITLTR